MQHHAKWADCVEKHFLLFRHLFETGVARCIAEGFVGGEIFATDASIIQADANKQ